ncbi:MAG: cytochrome c oxidase subunit 3 family protein [Polyangiaceae bacterium]
MSEAKAAARSRVAGVGVIAGWWRAFRDYRPGLAHQFESAEQQREAASLGMWVFLATEVLFFGGLLAAYTVYRILYFDAFKAASHELDVAIGAVNTGVLLTSSLTMACAVWGTQTGRRRAAGLFLLATFVLGAVFLGLKFYEYWHKAEQHLVPGHGFHAAQLGLPEGRWGEAQMFFCLYFGLTGLHALHMLAGMAFVLGAVLPSFVGWFRPRNHGFIEGLGLYWHFVDIVWVFLFPLLYLVSRHE